MFFALSLVLSSLIFPAACQFVDDFEGGFHPDGPTTGIFAILCIFALSYGVLSIWNFVALLVARGHRAPHALLLPTIVLWGWSNALSMAVIVLDNLPDLEFSNLLFRGLDFASGLTSDWASLLFFLAIIAVLRNRETALQRATTDGKAGNGGHHPVLFALHAVLAVLLFIFGTASPAMILAAYVKFYNTDFEFDSEFDTFEAEATLAHQLNIGNDLFYTFVAFIVLSGVDITATTVVLWRRWKKAGVSDKITNTMLYAVVPLYCIMCLLIVAFNIVFSPSGLPRTTSQSTFEGAELADDLLIGGVSIVILGVILAAGVKKAWWGTSGAAPVQQQWPGAQPQYMYATPQYGQVPQAGYYPAQPGQMQQYPVEVGQGQYVPQEQYAPAVQGGYTPHHDMSYASTPPPASASEKQHAPAVQGGYTPHHDMSYASTPPPASASEKQYAPAVQGAYTPQGHLSYASSTPPPASAVETSVGGYTPSPPPPGPYGETEKIGLHF